MPQMEWSKFYYQRWLRGSVRSMTREQRGDLADLIALACDAPLRDGTLRFGIGVPMPREWIAATLRIPLSALEEIIRISKEDKNRTDDKHRIEIWEDGTIEFTNFKEYQSAPRESKRPMDARQKELMGIVRARGVAKAHPEDARWSGNLRYLSL
mgnify:FL=1